MKKGVLCLIICFFPLACSIKHTRGTEGVALDVKGRDPFAQSGVSSSSANPQETRNRIQFEQNLKTKREKEQYSEILPLFKSESERLDFLSLNTVEERQEWIKSNQLWTRNSELYKQYKSVIEAQDITVGMTQELVKKSWGEPQGVEVSGNPIYKNERWRYTRSVSTSEGFKKEDRLVYFESGRVVGWETKF